ncbi:TLD-domain-containing protein [Piedraia hortae CBS 480.64]|uniref:Oxidation resistance protein 1 n=1 Tax=Piedraia hortae CBS 480.64 TaxID=1314780 RepID=A0A6A7C9Q9_9PEZI|nr:TLD-domain-containing protein [Piedraia hortae CBS 480.64]
MSPPPPPPPPPQQASLVSYLTHPISYSFTSLARRLSYEGEDSHTSLVAQALAAPSVPMAAIPRKLSPFQPPPLTPLTFSATGASAPILSHALGEEIRLLLPPRLQLVESWTLAYSLDRDGSALSTLYTHCDALGSGKRAGWVLVVKDADKNVFGAYLSDFPKAHPSYYGNGECFLWRTVQMRRESRSQSTPPQNIAAPPVDLLGDDDDLMSFLPPPPSADTEHLNLGRLTTFQGSRPSTPASRGSRSATPAGKTVDGGVCLPPKTPAQKKQGQTLRFKAFPYTGTNDFNIFCQADYLSVGGGDGHYGLWLDGSLSHGVSDTSLTFCNEPLSEMGNGFDVLSVEVWFVG